MKRKTANSKQARQRTTRVLNSGTEKLPSIRKAKYRVGEKVYSYQNPTVKMPIVECRAVIDTATPINAYRIVQRDKNGQIKLGSWISELSIYTVKKRKPSNQ